MADYSNGKIYKIEPLNKEKEEDIYIGSTTKEYLSQRMVTHKSGYIYWKKTGEKKLSVFDLFEKYGFDNCKIILLENVSCKSKDELVSVENKYIHNMKCVNINGNAAYIKKENKKKHEQNEVKSYEYDKILSENNIEECKNTDKKSEKQNRNMNEVLAQARIKAAETKRRYKEQRIKAEQLEKLKLEIKANEYDNLTKQLETENINSSKILKYDTMIELFEKRYSKSLLEILLEYEDYKKSI